MPVSIQESAVFSTPEKVKKYNDGKVVFETYLQEAEERNQNKRVYPKDVIDQGLRRIEEKIKKRSFLGELDHPISTNQVRQTTVLYKEVSHIIREWGWEGNLLRAVVETTPYTPNGRILSGLALDKVNIGFSLRGLADVQDNGQFQLVMSPLICICYDAVSEPSNTKATIQEVRNEHLVQVVNESKNLVCTSDGHCYLPDYFDQLVESKLITLKKKYWQ
jgi:hypothetical protein